MEYPGSVSFKSTYPSWSSTGTQNHADRFAQRNTEEMLALKAKSGDLAAFNELFLHYKDTVYQKALWILKEEEAAEDAVQEAFYKAYRKFDTFIVGKPLRSWLLKITTNQCLDMIRSAYRHPTLPLEPDSSDWEGFEPSWTQDPADTPEQFAEKAEAERQIVRAIQTLAPDYRAVIILVDLQELNYEEASLILNVPVGTMKSRLSRARAQLRKILQ